MKIKDIVEATQGRIVQGDLENDVLDISTDSRNVKEGMFFVPLKGESFDGHSFIEQAFKANAVGCITEKYFDHERWKNKCVIEVGNTLTALHDIARYYRKKFPIPFVAITGSVGKTTTKDMISCVLKQKYNTLKTQGNFNNEIGLPLTLFRLNHLHQVAVIEMGMSGFGEISRLVSITKPETAVITNIGLSHIEKLGSQKNILKAKMEVFDHFTEDSLAVLNGDDPLLFDLKDKLPFKTVFYGIQNLQCNYCALNVHNEGEYGSVFEITHRGIAYEVKVPVIGEHNIYNALAAICVGMAYNIEIENIIQGIFNFKPGKMRQDIYECKGVKIINDCYNASPTSMTAALKVLCEIKGKRKIAILGDMLEMGKWAKDAHIEVGKKVVQSSIDYLITVGYNGKNIASGALQSGMSQSNIRSFDSNDEINNFILNFLNNGDVILIKASRGMKLEEVSQFIREVR